MDFHSLCQKIDVDNIRAKFPPLPAMPSLPQIKLPKSMPKIKSRKIFRGSRENINRKESQKHRQHQQQQQSLGSQSQLAYPTVPPATFIKQTPTRISTISSLVHEDSADGSTYRSADSIDDFCPLSRRYSCAGDMHAAISPLRASTLGNETASATGTTKNSQVRLSFTEKLHRSYKDLSEFRIKNIFTKKTVVRKDDIRVEHYVERFKEDLVRENREQAKHDQAIAENYTFRFKLSRQNTGHSNSVTPDDSPLSEPTIGRSLGRTVGEHSGDESGMEATPPPRKPGIAATRFARVRSPPLRQSSSENETDDPIKRPEPIPSALWSTKINRIQVSTDQETENEDETEQKPATAKSRFNYKERVRRLASYISTETEAAPGTETTERGSTKMLNRLKSFGKRNETADTGELKTKPKKKTENSPLSTDEEQSPKMQPKESPTARTFDAIRNNFKRWQQSIKTRQHSSNTASDNETSNSKDDSPKKTKGPSKTEQLTSRLRRFRSRDVSTVDLDDGDDANEANKAAATTATQSPIRQAITNKLETWKKSFKKKTNDNKEDAQTSEAETSPEKEKHEKQKRSDTLIKKLKHIRSRKQPGSNDELEATNTDTEAGEESQPSKSKATKFNEARQRTFKKVNEKMQQIKFFHKSQEQTDQTKQTNSRENRYHSEEEDWDESPVHEHEYEHEHEEKQKDKRKAINNLPPAITRRDFPAPSAHYSEPEDDKPLSNVDRTFSIPTARAAWTSKPPLLSESMDSDADAREFPRVLIHQDNSDCFESTLIIAVTRSPSTIASSSSARITEIISGENSKQFIDRAKKPPRPEQPKQTEWIPNKNIIAGFLETTPPGSRRKKSLETSASSATGTRRQSADSNSDSDSWCPEARLKGNSSRRSSKSSQTGLISIDERSEAWKVKTKTNDDQTTLYKSKSIDIFEKNILKGGVLAAFEDFDDELKNEPVLKIRATRSADSYERESSEDTADDDNSSRITKISINRLREGSADSTITTIKEVPKESARQKKTLPQYANSRESLVANFDENEENEDSQAEMDENDDDDDDDRPPSAAPSPPPKMSPPPPPLPQRQPSMRLTKSKSTDSNDSVLPPPLPKSKPPLPPVVVKRRVAPPPRIPERTASMPRAPKPLVKTSSLRLVFSEQVKPADVGKVNKLISRFEPTEGHTTQRPRVIPRRMQQDDSEEYSDDEEDFATMADKLKERYANIKIERDTTPTPTNTPKICTPKTTLESPEKIINRFGSDTEAPIRIRRDIIAPMVVTTTDEDNNTQILLQHVGEVRPMMDLPLDNNSNCSRPNSEYGSPLEYPSSLRSSMETIPILERKDLTESQRIRNVDRQFVRSRRSMPRDNENYYSFDSDEENSYYSISSTGSNRYVVEL